MNSINYALTSYPNQETPAKAQVTSAEHLPKDVLAKILQYLELGDLSRSSLVNWSWRKIALTFLDKEKQLILNNAFGKKSWEKYFGDIGEVPPLPKFIVQILKMPCPFCVGLRYYNGAQPFRLGKKTNQTHHLYLIPKSINGENLTLNKIKELIKNPKQGRANMRAFFDNKIEISHGDTTIDKSYWILITDNIIPFSAKLSWKEQLEQAAKEPGYDAPTLLEAVAVAIAEFVSSEESEEKTGKGMQLSGKTSEMTRYIWEGTEIFYTCCNEELIDEKKIIVGGFLKQGLRVGLTSAKDCGNTGVAGCRRFIPN